VPKGSAEMVAAAIRTIFAQPTAAEVTDQVDKVAAMLAPKFQRWQRCSPMPART
jgi:putative transposase